MYQKMFHVEPWTTRSKKYKENYMRALKDLYGSGLDAKDENGKGEDSNGRSGTDEIMRLDGQE